MRMRLRCASLRRGYREESNADRVFAFMEFQLLNGDSDPNHVESELDGN